MKIKSKQDLFRLNQTVHSWLKKHRPDLLRKYLPNIKKNNITFDKCLASAKKYKTKKEWRKHEGTYYRAALKNNWIRECCYHMKILKKHYTKEELLKICKKFKNRVDWAKKDCSSYNSARRNGWLEECCLHMNVNFKKWTLKECLASAKKYQVQRHWIKKESAAYQFARKRGWLKACCSHMKSNKKSVINLDTKIIFNSLSLAAKSIKCKNGSNIIRSIKKNKTAGGYRWAYCDEDGNVMEAKKW